jgi:hypothetical protein
MYIIEQQILDLTQRKWIADVHHHREADHLGRAIEITEGIAHRPRLRNPKTKLKPIYSDNALVLHTQSPAFRPHPDMSDFGRIGRVVYSSFFWMSLRMLK